MSCAVRCSLVPARALGARSCCAMDENYMPIMLALHRGPDLDTKRWWTRGAVRVLSTYECVGHNRMRLGSACGVLFNILEENGITWTLSICVIEVLCFFVYSVSVCSP